MIATDPALLASRFRQALMPLVRQLRTNVEAGMTPGQMSALGTVDRLEPITLGDLAAAERVTPPMATKLANALEEKGLVERLPCADAGADVVLFVDVLHHTSDPLPLLAEARRVARQAIVIKDHLCDGWLADPTLRLMDWFGTPFNEKRSVTEPLLTRAPA